MASAKARAPGSAPFPGRPAGPAASSRWLGIDERPPHEQGAGALRFGSVGAVEGVDGGRPTSRGLPPAAVFGSASGWRFYEAAQCAPVLRHCHFRGSQPRLACSPRRASFREERGFRPFYRSRMSIPMRKGRLREREMTLPCPAGARGRCRCAEATLFAPAGQKRFRVARLILGVSRGKAGRWGALPIRNGWQARQKDEAYPFALHEAAASAQPSRGGNGGLCPHPLKGFIP